MAALYRLGLSCRLCRHQFSYQEIQRFTYTNLLFFKELQIACDMWSKAHKNMLWYCSCPWPLLPRKDGSGGGIQRQFPSVLRSCLHVRINRSHILCLSALLTGHNYAISILYVQQSFKKNQKKTKLWTSENTAGSLFMRNAVEPQWPNYLWRQSHKGACIALVFPFPELKLSTKSSHSSHPLTPPQIKDSKCNTVCPAGFLILSFHTRA